MVAYSFQKRFAAPVLAGLEPGPWRPGMKRWTLRHDRRRHARPGEAVQLYTGMRTRSCRLLGRAECLAVMPVAIGWDMWLIVWAPAAPPDPEEAGAAAEEAEASAAIARRLAALDRRRA